jgi:hypothetical protein
VVDVGVVDDLDRPLADTADHGAVVVDEDLVVAGCGHALRDQSDDVTLAGRGRGCVHEVAEQTDDLGFAVLRDVTSL